MKRTLFLLVSMLAGTLLFAQSERLELQLFELPDVIFQQIPSPNGYSGAYELRVKQPIDHNDPAKGHFYQRVFLSHRGSDRPTVIATEGYGRSQNRIYELSRLLEANQIDVEHRYFGESIPEGKDYTYLTLEQATADLHHIRELFGRIYSGKWVSTGISKGGQTTIFYRYFYPNDVDVSVPYVAPLNLQFEEPRIYTFLDTVGSDACRSAIEALQVRLLKERKKVLPMLKWFSKGAKMKFTYHSFEEAFEFAILEYPFSFWQWGHDCSKIPGTKAPLEEAVDHFLEVSNIDFFSDEQVNAYASHYYQAASEMGYYGYETEDFKGLLKALPMSPHPHAAFTPNKMEVPFDGSLPNKVFEWLKKDGDRFIYINGGSDTWSASAVPPLPNVDAVWFFLKGIDHGKARIRNMTREERKKLVDALERWLEMEIGG